MEVIMLRLRCFFSKKTLYFLSFCLLTSLVLKAIPGHLSLTSRPFGLENTVGVCYANTTLQCLFGYQSFINIINRQQASHKPVNPYLNDYAQIIRKHKATKKVQTAEPLLKHIYKSPIHYTSGIPYNFLVTLLNRFCFSQALVNNIYHYGYVNGYLFQRLFKNVSNSREKCWKRSPGLIFDNPISDIDFRTDTCFITVAPAFNLIAIAFPEENHHIAKLLCNKQFVMNLNNFLKKIWNRHVKGNGQIFNLKAIAVYLNNIRSQVCHAVACVKRGINWYLCDDSDVENAGKSLPSVVNKLNNFAYSLQTGYDTVVPSLLLFEVTKSINKHSVGKKQAMSARHDTTVKRKIIHIAKRNIKQHAQHKHIAHAKKIFVSRKKMVTMSRRFANDHTIKRRRSSRRV